MRIDFESFSALQFRNKALSRQVGEFKSGEKYVKMEADYKKLLRFHNQEMKRMKQELAKAHSETVTVRRYWGEVMDGLDKEHQAEVLRLPAKTERLEKENLELARQRDTAKDKLRERTQQYYGVAAELEEERGKNKKLTAQLNKDSENPSIPSPKQKAGKKKIPNSCSYMINAFPPIILCVKGRPGYIKGNRNRRLPCAARKTSAISVTD